MLNVTAQRSADAAKSYFAKSDYYSEGQELVGNWGGRGSILLGLFGEVGKRAFENICDNLDPRTQKPLTPITRGNRRTGYDFTWSAPKSVSVVHALTGDERIVAAFRYSVERSCSTFPLRTRVCISVSISDIVSSGAASVLHRHHPLQPLGLSVEQRQEYQQAIRERPAASPADLTSHALWDVHNHITAAAKRFDFSLRSRFERIGGSMLAHGSLN